MKNHRSSRIHLYGFLALLPLLVVAYPASAQPEQAQGTGKPAPAKFAATSWSSGSIIGIDAQNNVLEVKWPFDSSYAPKQANKIVITNATLFRREERGCKISDLAVGNMLLEVRNNNFDQKGSNASFNAQQLDVVSLSPLTLNVRGWSGGSWPPAEPKPAAEVKLGQTRSRKEALIEMMTSDEMRGIGAYVPHRSWINPQTGARQLSTTLVLSETSNMIFTRSVPIEPLAISNFHVGQRVSFVVTPRPDGKMTAEVIRLIVEQPQSPKK